MLLKKLHGLIKWFTLLKNVSWMFKNVYASKSCFMDNKKDHVWKENGLGSKSVHLY
jgi:hypothetical protein